MNRIEEDNPVIETRFYVAEVTPSRRVSDEYDWYWTNEETQKVSAFFKTFDEAKDWMDQHLPDEGKVLELHKQQKRRTITERWWPTDKVG